MSMSKKDFEAIALILRNAREIPASPPGGTGVSMQDQWLNGAEITSDAICLNMADYCATANPQFDRARFLKACGVQS